MPWFIAALVTMVDHVLLETMVNHVSWPSILPWSNMVHRPHGLLPPLYHGQPRFDHDLKTTINHVSWSCKLPWSNMFHGLVNYHGQTCFIVHFIAALCPCHPWFDHVI